MTTAGQGGVVGWFATPPPSALLSRIRQTKLRFFIYRRWRAYNWLLSADGVGWRTTPATPPNPYTDPYTNLWITLWMTTASTSSVAVGTEPAYRGQFP